MIQLTELSRIGFGSYRTSIQSKENIDALLYAIDCGCNVIDTASNYGNGDAEKMAGYISQLRSNKNIFIITKAGYISGENLGVLHDLNKNGKGLSDLTYVSDDFKHSIHPEYLEAQIAISLKRLNRTYIDGFLLHSPEYFFEGYKNPDGKQEYYKRIKKAFEFLEEKVKLGIIRYYGVSSNTLPCFDQWNSTDILQLVKCASEVSSVNHFKLIQFPFNIVEQAAMDPVHGNKSLIDVAKENEIVTFSNRPFNVNTTSGALKLATGDTGQLYLSEDDCKIREQCFNLIEEQLKKSDKAANLSDFPAIAYIKENWTSFAKERVFQRAFYETFYPFIDVIYEHNIPQGHLTIFNAFENISSKFCAGNAARKVVDYLIENKLETFLPASAGQSLTGNLCRQYLKNGIDHILVGLTKRKYVDDLRHLF